MLEEYTHTKSTCVSHLTVLVRAPVPQKLTFCVTSESTSPGNSAPVEGLFAVRTTFGPGVVVEERGDGT